MKKITLFLFLCLTTLANAQTLITWSDFENATLQGWTNTDGATTFLTVEDFLNPDPGEGLKILQKNCDGSQTAIGEMGIIQTQTVPSSMDNICQGQDCFAGYSFYMKNSNSFDIALQVGFKDVQGDRVVYQPLFPVIIPALSDWNYYELFFGGPNYLDGAFDFNQITEVKIFHNPDSNTSYDGQFVNGILEIDEIGPMLLLGTENLSSLSVRLSPNPTHDNIIIRSETQMTSYHMYDLSGKQIYKGIINDSQYVMDISFLTNGMYFIEITSDQGKEVHKIIKN